MDTEADVDMLIPDQQNEDDGPSQSAEEISRMFFKVGYAQLVLGLLLIGGGIVTTTGSYGEEAAGEGIWGGTFVLICGSLAITARYHLLPEVVIVSLIFNLLTSLLLAGGIVIAAVSTFSHLDCLFCYAGPGSFAGYTALNCGICGCIVLSIYLAVVFSKILHEKKNFNCDCCQRSSAPDNAEYRMVYIPPGMKDATHHQAVGSFMAVPTAQSFQIQQP